MAGGGGFGGGAGGGGVGGPGDEVVENQDEDHRDHDRARDGGADLPGAAACVQADVAADKDDGESENLRLLHPVGDVLEFDEPAKRRKISLRGDVEVMHILGHHGAAKPAHEVGDDQEDGHHDQHGGEARQD